MTEPREARELLFLRHLCRALSGVQEARWRMYHALDLEAPESGEEAEIEHLTALRETAPLGLDAARERPRTGLAILRAEVHRVLRQRGMPYRC